MGLADCGLKNGSEIDLYDQQNGENGENREEISKPEPENSE